ncbi:phage virion morphogenesis protein [Magnetococcus sp. PR-3]|uniref:phage virion morphogenesis protein n=1 Tax=Magnetococcus sp. PR-3 TaxID=3120355 RepID=UPI002FCE39ED
MSVGLQFDLREIETAARAVGRMGGLQVNELLDNIGMEITALTVEHITQTKADSHGNPWPKWSEIYAALPPKKRGKKLLEKEGSLQDSITHRVDGDESVQVGSNLAYAAIHQFGGAEVGKPGLPARPYLYIASSERSLLEDLVMEHLERLAP